MSRTLRFLALALALLAGISHLALSVANFIPSESTIGPVFAVMALVYLAGAAGILMQKRFSYRPLTIYALALIVAYAFSREGLGGSLPIDPIGVLTKVYEVALVVTLFLLNRSEAKSSR